MNNKVLMNTRYVTHRVRKTNSTNLIKILARRQ
jgi:hypothetical protein